VKALEEAGVIKGYAAMLDSKAVGLSVNVFMSVSLSTQNEKSLKDFERAAAERPEVMECYLMTGDSDYLLRVVVPDLEAYERFVMDFTKIVGIAQIRSSFALRAVKQGTALPLAPASGQRGAAPVHG
jgi:DNA-binding Lrp family transcriptional regulator